MSYPFSEAEAQAAIAEWGCNCGPSALAFALQRDLDFARRAIEQFESRRYTSTPMMRDALRRVGADFDEFLEPNKPDMFCERIALVRIQWSGKWNHTQWASHRTHWIATWIEQLDTGATPMVFDINGGIRCYADWTMKIVPMLLPKNGDGDWFPTHVLRLGEAER